MNEQTSNPTSGQNVPKSKFRWKSRQEQTAASKLRMERRGEKLDAAREKPAKQKPPKKPGAVKRLAHTAGHGVHGFVHGKLYEVEHENVGTEGAHRSELAAESVYRFGRRKLRKAIREHPAKAVATTPSKPGIFLSQPVSRSIPMSLTPCRTRWSTAGSSSCAGPADSPSYATKWRTTTTTC